MTTSNLSNEQYRQIFKSLNRWMVLIFRLGLGNFGNRPETSQVMVLVNTCRKTGLAHRTPVNYALVDGDIYCMAGFGESTDWLRNIKANPEVEVWLRDSWWAGVAEEVPASDPSYLSLCRQLIIASGIAARLLVGISPKTISDEALGEITKDYPLIRIQRTEARTGLGGPGDLAWIWPVATFVLLFWLSRPFRHPRRRRI